MSEWGWVGLGFAVAYGSVTIYLTVLWRRIRAARRRLEELR